jgi:hypothetical protein
VIKINKCDLRKLSLNSLKTTSELTRRHLGFQNFLGEDPHTPHLKVAGSI